MINIREYIIGYLLSPLKQYPTVVQDTMIESITQMLESLYDYTVRFPEILTPNSSRLDILKAIANQFLFTVREDADIQEQVDILSNLLSVYSKRGSIDTIENMWKYYGGNLPKNVKVKVPKVFKYSVSKLSGTHAINEGNAPFLVLDTPAPHYIPSGTDITQEGSVRRRKTTGIAEGSTLVFISTVDGIRRGDKINVGDIYSGIVLEEPDTKVKSITRTGAYEIELTNNYMPIADLKEFLVKELVAAGNYIYFTNNIGMDIAYNYNLTPDLFIASHADVSDMRVDEEYYLEYSNVLDILGEDKDTVDILDYGVYGIGHYLEYQLLLLEGEGFYDISVDNTSVFKFLGDTLVYCTPSIERCYIANHLYKESESGDRNNRDDDILVSEYPGYFILGSSGLGEVL